MPGWVNLMTKFIRNIWPDKKVGGLPMTNVRARAKTYAKRFENLHPPRMLGCERCGFTLFTSLTFLCAMTSSNSTMNLSSSVTHLTTKRIITWKLRHNVEVERTSPGTSGKECGINHFSNLQSIRVQWNNYQSKNGLQTSSMHFPSSVSI